MAIECASIRKKQRDNWKEPSWRAVEGEQSLRERNIFNTTEASDEMIDSLLLDELGLYKGIAFYVNNDDYINQAGFTVWFLHFIVVQAFQFLVAWRRFLVVDEYL